MCGGLASAPPYLFLRVKTLISQGLGVAVCKWGVPVSADDLTETGTEDQGLPRRNGFALYEAAGPDHAQKQVRFAFQRLAETGTPAFLPLTLHSIRQNPYPFLRQEAQK